jgi:hypothetical protein
MIISEFEKELKEIHPTLFIKKVKADISGVYESERGRYLGIAVPPEHIFDTFNSKYKDSFGYPYKTRPMIKLLTRLRFKKYVN